jgi:hypothetical protein
LIDRRSRRRGAGVDLGANGSGTPAGEVVLRLPMRTAALLLSLLSLLLVAPRPAHAEPASRKLLLDLAKLVLPEENYTAMVGQMETQLVATLQGQGMKMPPDAAEKLKRAVIEVMPYSEMLDWYVEIYSPRFSNEEIQQLIAFYKSPTGKKLARLTPEIGGEVGRKVGSLVPQRLPAALKKHGLTPGGASGSPASP